MGQACATTDGHFCKMRSRSRKPNRQTDHGSNCCGCDVPAPTPPPPLDCDRFNVDVEDLELSVEDNKNGKNSISFTMRNLIMHYLPSVRPPNHTPLDLSTIHCKSICVAFRIAVFSA